MNEQSSYRVTRDGLNRLEMRIQELQRKADAVSQQKAEAAGIGGDWHDNFAFEQLVREEQILGNQVLELRKRLSRAVIIEHEPFEEGIKIGSFVEIAFEGGQKMEFILTDPEIADPSKGMISYASPLGKAIFGVHVGESCTYFVEEREFHITVVRVEDNE